MAPAGPRQTHGTLLLWCSADPAAWGPEPPPILSLVLVLALPEAEGSPARGWRAFGVALDSDAWDA